MNSDIPLQYEKQQTQYEHARQNKRNEKKQRNLKQISVKAAKLTKNPKIIILYETTTETEYQYIHTYNSIR